eukprot:3237669-Rhodomonas_salina.1
MMTHAGHETLRTQAASELQELAPAPPHRAAAVLAAFEKTPRNLQGCDQIVSEVGSGVYYFSTQVLTRSQAGAHARTSVPRMDPDFGPRVPRSPQLNHEHTRENFCSRCGLAVVNCAKVQSYHAVSILPLLLICETARRILLCQFTPRPPSIPHTGNLTRPPANLKSWSNSRRER